MKFEIHYFDTVVSTMDLAREEVEKNVSEGFVVQAGEQLSGRGRRGNVWMSPIGNLYLSLILKPTLDRQNWGQLSFVIAVALYDTLLSINPELKNVNLKWPNDVLVNEKKIGGILIEVHNDYVIVGTGVNVEKAPDIKSKIHDFTNINVNNVRDILLSKIEKYYTIWQTHGFDLIRENWISKAYKINHKIQANTMEKTIVGVFVNIDKNGALILKTDNGEDYCITSSEIINWEK